MFEQSALVISALGVIAFIVSLITELTKEIGFLKKIPTMLQVVVLSIILWIVFYLALCTSGTYTFVWYMLICAVVAGFISAYIASYGWEKLSEIYSKYVK